jgi:thiamine monophosphate kinase
MVSEEILLGLYRQPETWAWISVMTSVSDLAACALKPQGLTMACQWAVGTEEKTQKIFFSFMSKALRAARVSLLGGDSGHGRDSSFTSTILGESRLKPLSRMGVKAGDYALLLRTHPVGLGPTLGLHWLLKGHTARLENDFRPRPDWRAMQKLRPFVNAAIDTSDGIATALAVISELNQVGFEIDFSSKLFAATANKTVSQLGLSEVMPLFGDHGDFHSLLFVSEKNLARVLKMDSRLKVLGQARRHREGLTLRYKKTIIPFLAREVMACPRDLDSLRGLTRQISDFYG